MPQPRLKLARDVETEIAIDTVRCRPRKRIYMQRAVRKRGQNFKIVAHPPTDQHLAEGIGKVLKYFTPHVLVPSNAMLVPRVALHASAPSIC